MENSVQNFSWENRAILSTESECQSWLEKSSTDPVGIYLLKVNNRNTRTRCEICSKLTIRTPE